ncbi:rhodanese-like domain-containing protein [Mucilaginibacter sp. SP1R1]|uniref:rhodanese-like domain-containing protein n=1 Tax=Mucilaginibacter sp. SP1R1 TaxID=2723091 RepID=UPI00161C504F|nr:rhodanese-like domain-containing protein [Mucilaginibacter sp. SP1R1]MBB6147652.1 phage shock protein E [Mucilaginibacter sp. SP1R1]
MKKLIILLLLLSAITVVHAQAIPQKGAAIIALTPDATKKVLADVQQGKAYLVDVRTPEEYNKEHLKYASNINIKGADFDGQIKKLDKNKPVYLYCHSGKRSGKATDFLQTLGYHQSYNIGALDSLTKAGFPVQ